ncbi:hypothetical protein Trydic_g21867 [Trypoxylus dichotomus]
MAIFQSRCLAGYVKYMSTVIPGRLNGKVAVVSGSTSGIGLAIAKRLVQEGAKVLVSGRKEQRVNKALREIQGGVRVVGTACHVSKNFQRIRMLELAEYGLGGIDILVLNVGINPVLSEVLETTERAWDKIFQINLTSSYRLAKETIPYMQKRGQGKILFHASAAGFQPVAGLGAYSVSKTALISLAKATALQLGKFNITVNAIAPGIITTKFSKVLRNTDKSAELLGNIPMRRYGRADEVAGVAAFLVSPDADYITGETICVSGGMISRL